MKFPYLIYWVNMTNDLIFSFVCTSHLCIDWMNLWTHFLSLNNLYNSLVRLNYFLDIVSAILVINIMNVYFPICWRRQFPDLDTLIQSRVLTKYGVTTMLLSLCILIRVHIRIFHKSRLMNPYILLNSIYFEMSVNFSLTHVTVCVNLVPVMTFPPVHVSLLRLQ